MKLDGIHHIGINVNDLDRAEIFYTNVLGFNVLERYDEKTRHSMLNTGKTKIHLFELTDLDSEDAITHLNEHSYAHIAFGTNREQFPKIIKELNKHKIPFRGPLILGMGESIHLKDPDGNCLEIRCPADII